MWSAFMLVIGLSIGAIIAIVIFRHFLVGDLRVDSSDPEDDPYAFLELEKEIETVTRKKYVILRVNTESLFSRK